MRLTSTYYLNMRLNFPFVRMNKTHRVTSQNLCFGNKVWLGLVGALLLALNQGHNLDFKAIKSWLMAQAAIHFTSVFLVLFMSLHLISPPLSLPHSFLFI